MVLPQTNSKVDEGNLATNDHEWPAERTCRFGFYRLTTASYSEGTLVATATRFQRMRFFIDATWAGVSDEILWGNHDVGRDLRRR